MRKCKQCRLDAPHHKMDCTAQPATKTVLGRVFTWNPSFGDWECTTLAGTVSLEQDEFQDRWRAELGQENNPQSIATGYGPTESDAILALQSTLRKMAELEVAK